MPAKSNRIFFLGNQYLVVYLTFISSFAPLSTDMYLPALPKMAQMLHTSDELISYSMTSFFFIYALSTLFWGPISDRYGRKPVLIYGSAVYIIACIFIAITNSIWILLIMRGLQAVGCAAASAMSLAIVKDVLKGTFMEKIVSFMQAAHILAPLCAPLIGGAMLYFINWRGVFMAQALCGATAMAGAFCLKETARLKQTLSLKNTFIRLINVVKNPHFLKPFILFSAMTMPFMSFLAVSAFVYQSEFNLSAQAFSLFFALNAFFSLLAPLAHVYCLVNFSRIKIITFELLIMFISGFLIICIGNNGPWCFALLMAPLTFCGAAMRVPSTILLMEANKGDNGAVSALIQFGALLFASFSMFIAPLSIWPHPVMAIGVIAAAISGICLLCWLKINSSL